MLGSQRDDQHDRPTDGKIFFDTTKHISYVKDLQSGGTRFACHDDNTYAVVLNHAPSLQSSAGLQSRGQIPLYCMDLYNEKGNLDEVLQILLGQGFEGYNSFVLTLGSYDEDTNELIHYVMKRNAVEHALTYKQTYGSLLLSAATLYTIEGHIVRLQELDTITTIPQLDHFLATHRYDPHSSYCISKPGVVTKSRTLLAYEDHDRILYTFGAVK